MWPALLDVEIFWCDLCNDYGLISPVTETALSWAQLSIIREGSGEIDSPTFYRVYSLLGGSLDDDSEIGNALSRLG